MNYPTVAPCSRASLAAALLIRTLQSILSLSSPTGSQYLDQWPLVGLVEQLDNGRDAIVEAHGVLGHLSLRVAAGEVAQGTHGRLCDVVLVTSTQDGVDESLHAAVLRHQCLVPTVVACQVGQRARGTGEDTDVVHTQLAHQDLQHTLQALLGSGAGSEE